MSGLWTQSNSIFYLLQLFNYSFTNGDFNFWDGIYNNLQDFQYVINNVAKDDQKYLSGPSKIMKAYLFHQLVDMY
ncbi:MAG: hypothetical protein IPQ18_15035 [Saprospiraceae bacterium]|nr:hypothetical protein [Saprospiraceae bacterium]